MPSPRTLWRNLFDVRQGEAARTVCISAYLLFVMVAYYILKPVSAAMFLHKFNIDRLPHLYILIAAGGGTLAYFYTRLAINSSLWTAVSWAMMIAVVCLLALWWLIGGDRPWMLYVFNVWVSLFSIVLVSQGWLVAANVFDAREAKRLYGLLGMGAVIGAGIGSLITTLTVKLVGPRNLILVSAVLVILAYGAFLLAAAQKGVALSRARAAEAHRAEFSPRDIFASIRCYRHLQVIIAIILITYIVDELVDFQFQAMAKQAYPNASQLTAFFGTYNIYLNVVSLLLQFFFTAWVVHRIGVGGTLKIMPISIGVLSLGSILSMRLLTTLTAKFAEAVNRYTFNRTGMELLYLPLPADLRNRTKAFMDVFVDRTGRGIAGLLLMLLLALGLKDLRLIAVLVIAFAIGWIALAQRAQKEYLGTVRARLERRRLDMDGARVRLDEPATLALLEQTALSPHPRQACYALGVLAEAADYDLAPLLRRLAESEAPEVRGKVYDLARAFPEFLDRALTDAGTAMKPAVAYVLAVAPAHALEFVRHPNERVVEAALEALSPDVARGVVTPEWLEETISSPDPRRRALAGLGIAVLGEVRADVLYKLLQDSDTNVVAAACKAAAALQSRVSLDPLLRRLSDPVVRGAAIEALAAFGTRITGLLGDFLDDDEAPLCVRRQIPRVLKRIPDQRSVDVLLKAIGHADLSIRAAVLKALNRLREVAPHLEYGEIFVADQILNEARHYFELYAALEPFRDQNEKPTATGLLERSLEERLQQTIERLFRLLGLRYSHEEMHTAWLAVRRGRREQFSAALEFLDNVLEPRLKKILLPMLDTPERLTERGRELFGVEPLDPESAVREMIRSGDPWLTACAMAVAAERKLTGLAEDISQAAEGAGSEVLQVAQAAAAELA